MVSFSTAPIRMHASRSPSCSTIKCRYVDMVEVPRLCSSTQIGLIQQLHMQNASLRLLPANFMRGLYVKKLVLSNNRIETIDSQAFAGLENILQSLDLSHNNLTAIPVGALDGMGALLVLDVSNNTLGDIDVKQALRNMPRLIDLNLGDNRICQVHKAAFDTVKYTLQTLNLGGNCLQQVGILMFHPRIHPSHTGTGVGDARLQTAARTPLASQSNSTHRTIGVHEFAYVESDQFGEQSNNKCAQTGE